MLVTVNARDDGDREDPQTAVIRFVRDDEAATGDLGCLPASGPIDVDAVDYADCELDGGATIDPGETYVFPNLRSGAARTAIEVIDDESPDVVSIESGIGTLVQKCGNSACTPPTRPATGTRSGSRSDPPGRSTSRSSPTAWSTSSSIGGVATPVASYAVIGGKVASRLFLGNLSISPTASR